MQYIKCVSNNCKNLSFGEVYTVLKRNDNGVLRDTVKVMADDGVSRTYGIHNFVEVNNAVK